LGCKDIGIRKSEFVAKPNSLIFLRMKNVTKFYIELISCLGKLISCLGKLISCLGKLISCLGKLISCLDKGWENDSQNVTFKMENLGEFQGSILHHYSSIIHRKKHLICIILIVIFSL